jgi:hypothetical protein
MKNVEISLGHRWRAIYRMESKIYLGRLNIRSPKFLLDIVGEQSIAWSPRFILDVVGEQSIAWSPRFILDVVGEQSIAWSPRFILDV